AWRVLTADVRDLVEIQGGSCRYCPGDCYRRQRTNEVRNFDFQEYSSRNQAPERFDEAGRLGYDSKAKPNAVCLECAGYGKPRVMFHDTRTISSSGAALLAGVKRTKFGIEIVTHSKEVAMEKLFRHL